MDSLRGEVWARKTRLTLPLFIELPVPSQESAQSCICVLRVSIFPVSRILIFDLGIVPTVWYFRIVPTVWYFFVFHFITTTTTTTTTMYTNLLLDTTLYDKEVS
jgi:hypothetical protein